jgi:murein DD-endopeptidase MepM/ murein hydrolase activator NlpD
VLAPCTGRVIGVHDGDADGSPVDLASPTARAGNYALIRCGQFDILLAHFRKDSLRVATGDLVRPGQPIGTLGSSGASDLPHLHIHAQRPGTAARLFSGEPIPMRIGGRYLVRGDRP